MDSADWIKTYLNKISKILKNDQGVISLCTFGSINDPTIKLDRWSDLDLLLVVKDSSISNYYPSLEWISPMGKFFALEQSVSTTSFTSKIIFDDFRKIDLLIIKESKINSESLSNKKIEIIFSKSKQLTDLIHSIKTTTDSSNFTDLYDINALSNEFWYLSHTALVKVARNDLLIAMDLTLDLYRKSLLISLWLRDRESNTNIHRMGGLRNSDITKLYFPPNPINKDSVIDMLDKISLKFDELAQEWSADYLPKHSSFHKLLSSSKD